MDARRITDPAAAPAAGQLFDDASRPAATFRFLADERHQLLIAYLDGSPAGGDERRQRRGVRTALVSALAEPARERGCYGMWTVSERDNVVALATYRRDGGAAEHGQVALSRTFAAEELSAR